MAAKSMQKLLDCTNLNGFPANSVFVVKSEFH
jgi:hypothetical protein